MTKEETGNKLSCIIHELIEVMRANYIDAGVKLPTVKADIVKTKKQVEEMIENEMV